MFRDKIQARYEDLSPRFRTLADFILEDTLDVGFLTATELARRVGVDPATVVRFSQELGYSGYRELSREIKRYINQQLALRYQKEAPATEGLSAKVALFTDELTDRILGMKADVGQIAAVAEKIYQAERIFVTSTSEGYGVASLWSTYLSLLGMEVYTIQADPARAALLLRDISDADILIALSFGLGPGIEVGNLLSAVQAKNIPTVSLTTSPTLLPARQADYNLVVPSKTSSGYPSFDTLMALLSILWQALLAINEQKARLEVKTTVSELNNLVDQQNKVSSYDVAALLRLWDQQ